MSTSIFARGLLLSSFLVTAALLAADASGGALTASEFQVPGGGPIVEAQLSATDSLDAALALIASRDPEFRDLMDAARSEIVIARQVVAAVEWPADLRRLRSAVNQRLVLADSALLRGLQGRNARAYGRGRRAASAALRHLSHVGLLLDDKVPPPPAASAPGIENADPAPASEAAPPTQTPAFTWTDLAPSPDSRIVYVSSSEGSDSNDGLSPATPVRTFAVGTSLLRDGYPDWLRLRRGDTWTGEKLVVNNLVGRSESERIVVSTYGTGDRPTIVDGQLKFGGTRCGNLAITGLSLVRTSEDSEFPTGIDSVSTKVGIENVLIEDCSVASFGVNISLQGYNGPIRNVAIRGCVLMDAYSSVAHSQNIFVRKLDDLLIEGCVMDHGGYNDTVEGAEADDFSHNAYLQHDCSGVVTRNNIFSNGSAAGLQQRSGGLCEENLFLRNPVNLVFGTNGPFGVHSGTVRRNVILDSRDISANRPRGQGIWLANVKDIEVEQNIVAHQEHGTAPRAVLLTDDVGDVSIHDNIVYDWGSDVPAGDTAVRGFTLGGKTILGPVVFRDNSVMQPRGTVVRLSNAFDASVFSISGNRYNSASAADSWFTVDGGNMDLSSWATVTGESQTAAAVAPSYAAPERTIATYAASLGLSQSFEAFIAEARKQSRSNWRSEFTANAVNDYIREGFAETAETK